jgi:ribonuclease P/MRP protein subunit RPP25
MADKYRRVEKAQETLPVNEIRVKRDVGIGRYLRRAFDLLSGVEEGQDSVVIKGVSNAMESAVKLAELVKHRVTQLHQLNKVTNLVIVDEYEPLEEGLDSLKFNRIVTMLSITLSKSPLDTKDIGY